MRCHICDVPLANPSFNVDHQDFDPCGTCQEVIDNVFGDTPDEEVEEAPPEEAWPVTESRSSAAGEPEPGRIDVV